MDQHQIRPLALHNNMYGGAIHINDLTYGAKGCFSCPFTFACPPINRDATSGQHRRTHQHPDELSDHQTHLPGLLWFKKYPWGRAKGAGASPLSSAQIRTRLTNLVAYQTVGQVNL